MEFLFKQASSILPVNYDNISLDFKVKQFTDGLEYTPLLRHQYWLGSFNSQQKINLYSDEFNRNLTTKNNVETLILNKMRNCDAELN